MTDILVPRGLDGVIVDETRICLPDKQIGRLCYRGYPIDELAAHAGCEEVAYLVVNRELPDAAQLAHDREAVQRASNRPIHPGSRYTGPAARSRAADAGPDSAAARS